MVIRFPVAFTKKVWRSASSCRSSLPFLTPRYCVASLQSWLLTHITLICALSKRINWIEHWNMAAQTMTHLLSPVVSLHLSIRTFSRVTVGNHTRVRVFRISFSLTAADSSLYLSTFSIHLLACRIPTVLRLSVLDLRIINALIIISGLAAWYVDGAAKSLRI